MTQFCTFLFILQYLREFPNCSSRGVEILKWTVCVEVKIIHRKAANFKVSTVVSATHPLQSSQNSGSKIVLLCQLSIRINKRCLTAWCEGTEYMYAEYTCSIMYFLYIYNVFIIYDICLFYCALFSLIINY